MGQITNQPKTLEERVRAVTKAAQDRNVDFDIGYVAARSEWTSNWRDGLGYASLSDLLDVLEEDIRDHKTFYAIDRLDL